MAQALVLLAGVELEARNIKQSTIRVTLPACVPQAVVIIVTGIGAASIKRAGIVFAGIHHLARVVRAQVSATCVADSTLVAQGCAILSVLQGTLI